MGHENGGWMNEDQRSAVNETARKRKRQGEAPPCESCKKPSDGYSLDDVPLCAECAGALAEVAAHEPGLTGADSLDELDPEAVNGVDARTGRVMGEPLEPVTAREPVARFGRRLEAYIDDLDFSGKAYTREALVGIAAEIDKDGDLIGRNMDSMVEILRRQVEEAVERLRYTLAAWQGLAVADPARDVLDVEPFLAALDGIFGERAARRPLGMAVGRVLSHLHITPVGDRVLLDGSVPLDVWREMDHLRRIDCGASAEHAAGATTEFTAEPEHEPAHDRRERESARHEDRQGRVEGVDR